MSSSTTYTYPSSKRVVIPSIVEVSNFGTGLSGASFTATLTLSGGVTCSYAATLPSSAGLNGQLAFVSCTPNGSPNGTLSTTTAQLSGTVNPSWLQYSTTVTAQLGYSIDDGRPCTRDRCVNGAVDNSQPEPAGTACNDSDVCNGSEACDGTTTSNACKSGTVLSSNDGDECTTPISCNPISGWSYSKVVNCPAQSGLGAQLDLTLPRQYQVTSGSDSWLQGLTAAMSLDAKRAGVLRGRIVKRSDGLGLSGVHVRLLGFTPVVDTDANGFYELAVNGGETYTVQANLDGYVPFQRKAVTRWHDFTVVSDVAMSSEQAGTPLPYNTSSWRVARGANEGPGPNNVDGTRRTTVLIPPFTTFSNWSNPPTTLTYKVTEATVGALGPIAMPAELPYQSGYTFAADLAIGETPTSNGVRQTLNFVNAYGNSVFVYVENFTNRGGGLPSYSPKPTVPSGSYDMGTGRWTTEAGGKMFRYLGTSGGLAQLSLDGTTELSWPTGYQNEGISDGERQQLASVTPAYGPNTDLWRVPLKHFTTFDFNWRAGLALAAIGVPELLPLLDTPTDCNADPDANTQTLHASIVECTNQVLGEDIPVAGTPVSLHYRSEAQNGYHPTITVPWTDGRDFNLGALPSRAEVEITAAGQRKLFSFPFAQNVQPPKNQRVQWSWDRTDAYGRLVQGTIQAHVTVRYVYPAVNSNYTTDFAAYGNEITFGQNREEREIALTRTYDVPIGGLDARPLGLGGWTVSMNHVLEPETGVVWFGYGGKRTATTWQDTVKNVLSTGSTNAFWDLVAAPDGKLYSAYGSPRGVYRFDGTTLTKISGTGSALWTQNATLGSFDVAAVGVAISPDAPENKLYVADTARIFAVDRTSLVTTLVAGNPSSASPASSLAADGAIAVGTTLGALKHVAVGADGSVYFSESGTGVAKVRRISTNGKLETVVGGGSLAFCAGCNSQAVAATGIDAMTLDASGAVVFAPSGDYRVWRVLSDGRLELVAGDGQLGSGADGDGDLATSAKLTLVRGLSSRASSIYITQVDRVRAVSVGVINTVLGAATGNVFRDGKLGTSVVVGANYRAVPGPDGYMYLGGNPDNGSTASLVRFGRIQDPSQLDASCPSGTCRLVVDGNFVYRFDNASGRHIDTLSRFHNQVLYHFDYVPTAGPDFGKLWKITDQTESTKNVVELVYASGSVTIKPFYDFSKTTVLALNAQGYLATLTNPNSEAYGFTYAPTTSGLLATLTEPLARVHNFTFDPNGLLLNDRDPTGAPGIVLTRSSSLFGYDVKVASGENRITRHSLTQTTTSFDHMLTDAASRVTTFQRKSDRSTTLTLPALSGQARIETTQTDADPIWGLTEAPTTEVVSTNGATSNYNTTGVTRTLTGTPTPYAFTDVTDTTTFTPNGTADALGNTEVKTTRGASTADVVWKRYEPLSTTIVRHQITSTFDTKDRLGQITVGGYVPNSASVLPAVTSFSYDHNRIKTITQTAASGTRTVDVTYNATQGWVEKITTPFGVVATYDSTDGTLGYDKHDAAGRPKRIRLPGSRYVDLAYDANGNMTSVVPLGKTHLFTPNNLDLLATYNPPAISGPSGPTSYTYDKDRLARSIAEPQAMQLIDRDVAGRLQTVRTPTVDGDDLRTYTYDEAGHLETLTSRVGGVDAVSIADYYSGDRMSAEATTIFDNNGAYWNSHWTAWTYDDFNRPINRVFDGTTAPFSYAYDGDGYLKSITAGGATNVTYNIRRTSNNQGNGPLSAGGLVSGTTFSSGSNSLTDTYEYDAFGAITKYVFKQGSTIKYQVDYVRYPDGRVKDKTENLPDRGWSNCNHHYDYDARNFLTNVTVTNCPGQSGGVLGRSNTGNLTQYFLFNAQDRMTSDVNGTCCDYGYDSDGDITSISNKGSSTALLSYSYDVPGNLRRYSPTTWAGNGFYRYRIDGHDRRVARFPSGIAYNPSSPGLTKPEGWLYEGDRIIAELNDGGWIVNAFAYGTKRNVPDLMLHWNPNIFNFELYRIVSDQLGSPVLVIKVDGNAVKVDGTPVSPASPVLESYAWDEFGNAKDGAWPTEQPFGFAGGLWDGQRGAGTWMYRMGARDYSTRATWWSKDPARFGGGMNLYLYANGDPVNFIDPRGGKAVPVGVGLGAGLVIGGAATWGALGAEGLTIAAVAPYALPVLAGAAVFGGLYYLAQKDPLGHLAGACSLEGHILAMASSDRPPRGGSAYRPHEYTRSPAQPPGKRPEECLRDAKLKWLICQGQRFTLGGPLGDVAYEMCMDEALDEYIECINGP